MLPAQFCELNAYFDSNLNTYVNYKPGVTYVLRFYLDRWEKDLPLPANRRPIVQWLAQLLAAHDELPTYDLKAVCLRRLEKNKVVSYYQPHFWSSNLGSGCNEQFTSSDSTWCVDVVFAARVTSTEASWSQVQKWQEWIASKLIGSQGKPTVYIAGLIALTADSGATSIPAFNVARTYWDAVPGYYQITQVADANEGTGYKGELSQINKSEVWTVADRLGKNGIGLSVGDAFEPDKLQVLPLAGTISPTGPGTPTGSNTPAGGGGGDSSAPLSAGEKVVATAVGAAIMYYLYQRFVRRY